MGALVGMRWCALEMMVGQVTVISTQRCLLTLETHGRRLQGLPIPGSLLLVLKHMLVPTLVYWSFMRPLLRREWKPVWAYLLRTLRAHASIHLSTIWGYTMLLVWS